MKMQIENDKLTNLLLEKKKFIGKNIAYDSLASAISLLISVWLAEFKDTFGVPGEVFKYIAIALGIFFTIKALYDLYQSRKNNYTYEDLLSDINSLNEVEHYHSIILIMNTFDRYPNKYLVYDDQRWNCKLFVNYKQSDNGVDFIRSRLSAELKIDAKNIGLHPVKKCVHSKYSESAGKEKIYSHTFYKADIKKFSDALKEDSFEIDGRKYSWMTLDELERDEEVKKKNLDIVNMVKAM